VRDDPGRLRLIALVGGLLLAAQAVALAVVVAASHPAGALPAVVHLRGADGATTAVPLAAVAPGWAAVVLLALGAVARLALVPRAVGRRRCDAIARNRHPARWWEWSFTLPIAVFLVAQLNGVAEVPALVLVYAVTAGAVLTAALQELVPTGPRLPLMLAAAVGIVPWGVIAFVQVGAGLAGHPPSGVVRVLTLVALVGAAAFWWLLQREQGRVRADRVDARGERAVSILGLVLLSALAWLVLVAA